MTRRPARTIARTRLSPAWLCGLVVMASAGCNGDPASGAVTVRRECPEHCRITEGAPDGGEPEERCIFVRGCRHSGECPAGTRCVQGMPGGRIDRSVRFASCRDRRDAAVTSWCALEGSGGTTSRRELFDGFEVPGFDLERVTGEEADPGVFEWSPPDDARLSVCALFVCVPEVRLVDDGETRRNRISNFDLCAAGLTTEEPARGTVSLEDMRSGPADGDGRVFEGLLGCWAYDGARITAATELVPLEPRDLARTSLPVVPSCSTDSEGESCFLGGSTYGECLGETCRRRCVVQSDCREAQPDGGFPADGGAGSDIGCTPTPTSYSGVCEEPP